MTEIATAARDPVRLGHRCSTLPILPYLNDRER